MSREKPDRPPPQVAPPTLKVNAKEWVPSTARPPPKQVSTVGGPMPAPKQISLVGGPMPPPKQISLSAAAPAAAAAAPATPAAAAPAAAAAEQKPAEPAASAPAPVVESASVAEAAAKPEPVDDAVAEAAAPVVVAPSAAAKEKKPEAKAAPKPAPAPAPASKEDDGAADEAEGEIKEADAREHLNCVFIGHVDAGKSTLCGSILLHTGVVDKRTIERYEKEAKQLNRESWFLAFIMDTNEEERARGKTVEVGRENFETPAKRFTILDAPGHKNYVPAMIAGASHADVGVLVISSSTGEFESGFEKGGQTREHAMLAFTLGIRKLIVAVNKMDAMAWSRERMTEIETKLTPYLKSCGYKVKKDVVFLPLAALRGAGVLKRVAKDDCPWIEEYNEGKSLIEILEGINIEERNSAGALRMSIMDSYNDRGIWAMGKIESGTLRRGSQVVVSPTGIRTNVVAVVIDSANVQSAKTGENVCVKLSGGDLMSEADATKGFVLCDEKFSAKVFTATIRIVELLEHRRVFTAGYRLVLHSHTIACDCLVAEILWKHDPETKKPLRERCTFANTGDIITVRLEVPLSIAIEPFDVRPQLGRVTLRDQGKSIAIGTVKKIEQEGAKKE